MQGKIQKFLSTRFSQRKGPDIQKYDCPKDADDRTPSEHLLVM